LTTIGSTGKIRVVSRNEAPGVEMASIAQTLTIAQLAATLSRSGRKARRLPLVQLADTRNLSAIEAAARIRTLRSHLATV
jgi:hypothetical protein